MTKEEKHFLKSAKLKYRLNRAKCKFLKARAIVKKDVPTMQDFIESCLDKDFKINMFGKIYSPETEIPVDGLEFDPALFLKKELIYNLAVEYMFELSSTIKNISDRYRKKLELIKECDMEELKNGK